MHKAEVVQAVGKKVNLMIEIKDYSVLMNGKFKENLIETEK